LHAGGGISYSEDHGWTVPGLRVRLPDPLAGYTLPKPNMGLQLIKAITAARKILRVAPLRITVPCFAAVWRAALGGADFSLFLVGPSGAGKSEIAALLQQFWGRTMDARHLPANWASTANCNEALAFHAKDALLVVDDFAPGGGQFDVVKLHREADRLLRGQGNSSGRGRMRADVSLRPPKPPRGLIVATGEDTPRGVSLRARMEVLDVSPDDVDWKVLTECQKAAGDGVHAQAMAGFLCWLAERYGDVRRKMPSRVKALRAKATVTSQHKRIPAITGDLYFGLELFAEFAVDVAALGKKEAAKLLEEGWKALGEAAEAQAAVQAGSDPVQRFIELLNAALAAGRAHVANKTGEKPDHPEIWGWRHQESGWQPRGDRIGWVDAETLYLEPEMAFTVAQRLGQEGGEPLAVGSKTVHKRLYQRRLLKKIDEKRRRLTPRVTLEGKVREVLHVHARLLATIPVAVPGS
jgi:hypothetical protein